MIRSQAGSRQDQLLCTVFVVPARKERAGSGGRWTGAGFCARSRRWGSGKTKNEPKLSQRKGRMRQIETFPVARGDGKRVND